MDRGLESVSNLLEQKRDKVEHLDERKRNLNAQRRQSVTDTLYSLQDSLEGESVKLLESKEASPGGVYVFDQVLYSDGVRAENVRRIESKTESLKEAESSDLYGWPSENEPLDIEDQYLSLCSEDMEFFGKLEQRIAALSEDSGFVPQDYRGFG